MIRFNGITEVTEANRSKAIDAAMEHNYMAGWYRDEGFGDVADQERAEAVRLHALIKRFDAFMAGV